MQWTLWIFVICCCGLNNVQSQERVAPGVPPQHYQQPHHGQNMHQMPQHQMPQQQMPQHQIPQHQVPQHQVPQHQVPQQQYQQQVPQMQQQPHMQQQVPQMQQQHVPVQQIPEGHGHGHDHHHGQQQQILNAANIAQEKAHIAEHLDVPMDTSKMTEQELQFHYFKMHDADNNNKLDGCELIKSLIHWHEEGNKDPNHGAAAGEKIFQDDELVTLIDPILDMDDTNKDGYIDYPEFIQAQQKAASPTTRQ
ncbi:sex-determining region Y protein [Nasonia vitripennis]|uniref:EF-hand domain-containing protein n=2 Tax=Pteromalinae TaxID=272242 RepID=A0A7M7HBU0_NASVI|nr:sex-determining region Y protein [Nasonia vitripennis]XP_031787345.1 sex-determining region Y protein [Nasonia vitripennis]OXU26722.1 hypothetical protein TSAR_000379 [Trichomalopsis sarcophagae]